MLLLAKTVTAVLAVVTEPEPSIKVTLGSCGVSVGRDPTVTVPEIAGREPMVTEFKT